MQQEVLPTDKHKITVKLGIPSPQTPERLEIQKTTVKRMLLFRPELLSLNSRYSQSNSWKRLEIPPHLHILPFLTNRQPRQTHLYLHFKFYDNSLRWSHNTSTETKSYGKNLRNVYTSNVTAQILVWFTWHSSRKSIVGITQQYTMQRDQISASKDAGLPRYNPSNVSGFRRGIGEVLALLRCYTVRVTADCRNVDNQPRTYAALTSQKSRVRNLNKVNKFPLFH